MRFLFFIVYICLFSFQQIIQCYPTSFNDTLKPRFLIAKRSEIASRIITGAEQTELYIPILKGKSVALVVNQTSLIGNTHLVDSLISLGINVKTIFAPEHGFRGDHSAGAKVIQQLI